MPKILAMAISPQITSFLPEANKKAILVAKEKGVVAGLPVAEMVFKKFDKQIEWNEKLPDGSKVKPGDVLVEFNGNYRALFTGERKALNFFQRLSGIATYAQMYERSGRNKS